MLAKISLPTCLFFLAIILSLTDQVFASQKHALLIGINDYENIPSLKKAVGDAQAMAQTMKRLGFKITLLLNPDRRTLNRALTRFRASIALGDTSFIHYSGHGIEIKGRNFLLPADIPKPNSDEQDFIESEALSLNKVIDRMANSGAGVRIFVIDACRDNPFAQGGTRSLGGTRGLAEVKTTAGTFIFYSAGFGQTALDSLGNNDNSSTSVYTRVLIETIQQPFSHIGSVARKTRQKVEKIAKSIGHNQFPAYYDELSGDYCIVCSSGKMAHNNLGTSPFLEATKLPPQQSNPVNFMAGRVPRKQGRFMFIGIGGCRESDGGRGRYRLLSNMSLTQCKSFCLGTTNPACKAIEYNKTTRKCEVHSRKITKLFSVPSSSTKCYVFHPSKCEKITVKPNATCQDFYAQRQGKSIKYFKQCGLTQVARYKSALGITSQKNWVSFLSPCKG